MTEKFFDYIKSALKLNFGKSIESASATELYNSIGKAFNAVCADFPQKENEKRAAYFSAEFLVGKLTKSNLYNLGLLEKTEKMLNEHGRSLDEFENFDDLALGNGGLGRLAACFLDSAASINIPLDGYGIRYRYGYFRQVTENNEQKEEADDWLKFTDAFGMRKDEDTVEVCFRNEKIKAVPYIYYIPGYENNRINRLCLFQAEAIQEFEYEIFDRGDRSEAFGSMISAMTVSANLYPNDNSESGKILRLKQQYFFTSAALQLIIKKHIDSGKDIRSLPDCAVIQLNDTHPTVAVPELIRLVMNLGEDFDTAFDIAGRIFAYTNHTVLAEALEKWDEKLFLKVVPDAYDIIKLIDEKLRYELKTLNIKPDKYLIINDGAVHMANLACYVSFSVNGVAKLHTDIIKSDTLNQWYQLYPKKFNNKTNGVTQRRWLALSNPELTDYISKLIGENCMDNFGAIIKLSDYADNPEVMQRLYEIRYENKKRLCNFIYQNEHIKLSPDFIFCTQVKRLHEYKRQLMNILSIIHIYLSLKNNEIEKINPTVFLIGAKAAPGYRLAKRIIEFICVVSHKINADPDTNSVLKAVFVSNYNVSCAEKIIPATDISEQISLAGKEASGTSNMKFMMNGAVTLGTYDGANIEIVRKAGEENNYIFGLRENEARELIKTYDPLSEYEENTFVKRAVDTLIDATFLDENDEPFNDIYASLVDEDRYMVMKDLPDYIDKKLKAISDYSDRQAFFRKSLLNTANSADFSSDRTVEEYADKIWFRD